jgi:hypothetical protein
LIFCGCCRILLKYDFVKVTLLTGEAMKTLTTLGDFVVNVAYGTDRKRVMSEQDAQQARRELSQAVAPKIEEVRSEQRKVFEDSKSVMIF